MVLEMKEEEPLKRLVDIGQKSFLKIQNIVAERGPVEFEDVKKYSGFPHSTVFKALKTLVDIGTVIEVKKEKDTTTGMKNVSYYSTPFKAKIILLERQETFPKLKVEAFDIALLGSSLIVFSLLMLDMFREGMGVIYGLLPMLIYWVYTKILKRGGKWVEVKI